MARLFDGSDDELRSSTIPVSAVPFTVAAWIWPNTASLQQTIFGLDDDGGTNLIQLFRRTANTIRFNTVPASGIATTANLITAAAWNHVIASVSPGNAMRVRLNGGTVATATGFSFPAGLDDLVVSPSDSGRFAGRICEVAVWNVQLSAAEEAALARGVNPHLIRPGALVFYAPIWGTSSPERDYTNGQRHLTVTGTTIAAHAPVQTMPPWDVWVESVQTGGGVSEAASRGGVVAGGVSPTASTSTPAGGAIEAGTAPGPSVPAATGGLAAEGRAPSTGASVASGGLIAGGVSPLVPVFETPTPGGAIVSGNAPAAAVAMPGPSPGYRDEVIRDAPVAYWRLGETSGSVANDETGNHDGTYVGGTLGTPGALVGDSDPAVTFAGTQTHRVSVPDHDAFDIVDALSVEAWIYPTLANQNGGVVEKTGTGDVVNQHWLLFLEGGQVWARIERQGIGLVTIKDDAEGDAPLDTWGHYVMTWDGTTLRLYRNGVLRKESAPVGPPLRPAGTGELRIGHLGSSIYPFTGRIDEVAFYASALSLERIAAHYEAGLGAGSVGVVAGGVSPSVRTQLSAGGAVIAGAPPGPGTAAARGGATASGFGASARVALASGGATITGAAPGPATALGRASISTGGFGPLARTAIDRGGAVLGGYPPSAEGAPITETPPPGGLLVGGRAPSASTASASGGAASGGQGPAGGSSPTPGGALVAGFSPGMSSTVSAGGAIAAGALTNVYIVVPAGGVIVGGRAPAVPATFLLGIPIGTTRLASTARGATTSTTESEGDTRPATMPSGETSRK